MRTKRRKSERNSESETEENGDQSQKRNEASDEAINSDENNEDKEDESDENNDQGSQLNRKSSGKKRLSRGRQSEEQKMMQVTNSKQTPKSKKQMEDADELNSSEQENGNLTRRGLNKKRKKDEVKTDLKASPTSSRGAATSEEYEVLLVIGMAVPVDSRLI